MKFETLRNKKKILLFTIIFVLVGLTLILNTTKAKYRATQRINIAKGNISYSLGDFSLLGIYLQDGEEYTSSDSIPESGYILNSDESYCKKGDTELEVTITYDATNKALSITPMTEKGTKCYLYFDEKIPSASETILANINTITTRSSFSSTYTASTTGTIFAAEDDDGISYYFAGAPTDNYVKFAGFYWRIIRINGDGSLRMIYDGTTAQENGTSTSKISNSAYNTSYNNNMYVGYMYTSGNVHGYGTSSTIKGVLDKWYKSNLTSDASKIDTNAGFCNDRQPSTSSSSINGSGGTGTTTTYYAAYIRTITSGIPDLKCNDSNDLFTHKESSKGNKALTYPIGLITIDEIVYAGLNWSGTNNNSYLFSEESYWSMSPSSTSSSGRVSLFFWLSGSLDAVRSDIENSVRPVINLRADTIFQDGGTGTSTNPYVVM